jgi:hypothetical protein
MRVAFDREGKVMAASKRKSKKKWGTQKQTAKLRERLIRVARSSRGRVAYSAIAGIVGLNMGIPADRTKLGGILGTMGAQEVDNGRPFLPAVVVRKWGRRPGPGFYLAIRKVCHQFARIRKKPKLHDAVLDEVYSYWQKRRRAL